MGRPKKLTCKCGQPRDLSLVRAMCRDCYRVHKSDDWRKYKYNMTSEQYASMMVSQGGRCAACDEMTTLVVDHDHISGEVRSLLCNPCNLTIGQARENVGRLVGCTNYLIRFSNREENCKENRSRIQKSTDETIEEKE